jgi:4-hydroxy-4-methyl-2-oxoglutarate aldolase
MEGGVVPGTDNGDLVARLGKLDSCVVSDAMDRLGLKGVAFGLTRLATKKKLFGRVLTVKLDEAKGRTAARHLCTAAVDAAGPGDVIVIEHHSRTDCAGWGGILSAAAVKKSLSGVIIDGMARDVDESEAFGLPVFGKGAVPSTARGRIIETEFNTAVTICGIPVKPGDYALADGSGTVFLPADKAEQIIATAEGLAAREADMMAAVRQGTPVAQVMAGNYERMLEKNDG